MNDKEASEFERLLQEEPDDEKVWQAIERWLAEPQGTWVC